MQPTAYAGVSFGPFCFASSWRAQGTSKKKRVAYTLTFGILVNNKQSFVSYLGISDLYQ